MCLTVHCHTYVNKTEALLVPDLCEVSTRCGTSIHRTSWRLVFVVTGVIIINFQTTLKHWYVLSIKLLLTILLMYSLSNASLSQNNIPVYSPALTDGSIGDMIYMHSFRNPGLILDIAQGNRISFILEQVSFKRENFCIFRGFYVTHKFLSAKRIQVGAV